MDSGSLHGVRVWLSGAVPEDDGTNQAERDGIIRFVRLLARSVFERGGYIIHGSHPSLTPSLLDEARGHQQRGGKRDCLVLAVSRMWSKKSDLVPVAAWREVCTVNETAEAEGDDSRDESLKVLRNWMAARCDAFVAVGGKWWSSAAGRAGVPIEAGLAIARGLPCFLLGGLGGAAGDFVRTHPELLRALKNGLELQENEFIATSPDIPGLAIRIVDQLGRLPIIRGRVAEGATFRILALDGGGIKGTFTAAVLATWEKQLGRSILGHFDLIAGTSTGGIIAIGLGLGLSAEKLLRFYRDRGPIIFPMTSFGSRLVHNIRYVFQPKFSQEILLSELQAAYNSGGKSRTLRESQSRLLIPSYHAVAGISHAFRTPHHSLLTGDGGVEAAHAALATAAAPTFFAAAKVGNMVAESSYFDGGVWANSPAMAAIVESVCYLGVPLDRIDVLSVGTTQEPSSVRKKVGSGLGGWNKGLIDLLMNVQSESSLRHARLLAGEPRFLRVNCTTPKGAYKLDHPNEIGELAQLGNLEGSRPDILSQVRSRFLNGVPVEPWQQNIVVI
jgi:hypothetical protein